MNTHQTLIVARADRNSLGQIGTIFSKSDAGELPRSLGVRERTLFHFHDLYFHLIRSDKPIPSLLASMNNNLLFQDISQSLSTLVHPYSEDWESPRDAVAQEFYRWSASPTG